MKKKNNDNNITVFMYHYVRKIKESKFPFIKGIEFNIFLKQLDFIKDNFNIITPFDITAYLNCQRKLPNNSCMLTFDDGFKDNVDFVLPELLKRKMTGLFFPNAKACLNNDLLDVHAAHLILSSYNNDKLLLDQLFKLCIDQGINSKNILLWKKITLNKVYKYDSAERVLIKRMFQYLIPLKERTNIINQILKKKIGISAKDLAKNFYLNLENLKYLLDSGMFIGSHGYNHNWLGQLSYEQQKNEINESLKFLKKIGVPLKDWVMCYPYGDYNNDTIKILEDFKCGYAFIDSGGTTILNKKNRYHLNRYDIKDFKFKNF